MPLKRGISLLELLGLPPGSSMMLGNDISSLLERLAVLDFTATTAGDVHVYTGVVQSLADAGLSFLNSFPVEVPMFNTGLPFQLIKRRAPLGMFDNVEPAVLGWQIDFQVDRVAFTFPGLRPAQRVESSGTAPRHLVPDPTRSKVRVVGGGTMRFSSNPTGLPTFSFVSPSDPVDPDAPAGTVSEVHFDPPHFFFGRSEVGMTVDRLLFDHTTTFTPDEIAARGHGADWQGISIREATVYMPRHAALIGDTSAGVRDVLLGRPAGLQGELQVEFGVPPTSPAVMQFFQNDVNGDDAELEKEKLEGKGDHHQVTYIKLKDADHGHIKASGPDATAEYLFTLPDGSVVRGPSSGYFDVRTGSKLGVQPVETDDTGKQVVWPSHDYHFIEGDDPHVPTIGVSFAAGLPEIVYKGPLVLDDVVFVSGRREHLQGMVFTASVIPGADPWDYRWAFGAGLGAETALGATMKPQIPHTLGKIDLRLSDGQGHVRRLRVEVVTEGPLVLGTRSISGPQAWTLDDGHKALPLKIRGIEGIFSAAEFNASGLLDTTYSDASVDVATGAIVSNTGSAGTLAEVTLDMGYPDAGPYAPTPGAPPPQARRHLQVVMEFGTTDPVNWGMQGLGKPFSIAAVQEWAALFGQDAQFVVIGRTCDIGSDDDNEALAAARADAGAAMLVLPGVLVTKVSARGEFAAPAAVEASITAPMTDLERKKGHLIKAEYPDLYGGDSQLGQRVLARRIDIYAVGGDDAAASEKLADEQTRVGPALRRALLPGADLEALNIPPAPGTTKSYRVRLTVKWDSPTVASWADAIPTLAEVLVTWQKTPTVALPSAAQAPQLPAADQNATVSGPEVFTLLGRWTHDSRSGATLFSLAFNNDGGANGLFHTNSNVLATAMMLAPALLSGITADSPSGAGARLGALLGASVAAAKYVNGGRVVVHGIEVQEQQRALGQFSDATHRILLDYTSQINVAVNHPAITINTTNPLKVRFENCGIEVDTSKTGLAAVNLVYDEAKFDVEDPGEWVIGGNLGKLLRVAGTRAGSGSVWFEIDLELALDLGPIKLTTCTVRITFPTKPNEQPGFELRGLGVEIDIPKVLRGKGRLVLGAGGEFKSDIQVKVIPAEVEARATLILSATFNYLEVGVRLPMGIPLGTSGLGIFGFLGRFVVNGRRAMPSVGDPVDNEIAWYRKAGVDKYTDLNAEGQHALGLGAILGTMPDSGFSFGATGMLTVAFPDPEVVISLDAKMFKRPELEASDDGPEPNAEPGAPALEMLGIIAANEHEFILGVRGKYSIPKVLKLEVPIAGYFPIGDATKAYYLRIGSDGANGRTGAAVTATLLPEVVDFKCWLFLMMEEKELLNLGNAPKWGGSAINLNGYSLGLGAGFDIDWSADPFSLHASAIMLLGLGTKPLTVAGMIAAEGELDLVLVSATVQARVQAQIQRIAETTSYWLDGEFKAEVDLGVCTVGGSINFHLDEGGKATPPEPEHPLLRLDLVDRRGTVTGAAARVDPQGNGTGSTVWPDTTPVLHFAHKVVNALQGSSFNPGDPLPGEDWSGASELRYAFRLKRLVLRKQGGAALPAPLDSVWWWPTHKGGLINPVDPMPSQHEARALALLSWNPVLASYSMSDGGKGGPGDPLQTLQDVCAPPVLPKRNIVLGHTATGQGLGQVKMVPPGPGAPPLPSWFTLLGTASLNGKDYASVVQMANAQGKALLPSQLVKFPVPVNVPGEPLPFTGAWELPRVANQNWFDFALQWDAQISNYVNAPALTLAVWNRGDRAPVVTTQCDNFQDLKRGDWIPRTTLRQGWRYESLAVPPAAVLAVDKFPMGGGDGKIEIGTTGGLLVEFSTPVNSVTVDLVQWGSVVTLRAFNTSGGLVAQASSLLQNNVPQKVTVTAATGIKRVHLTQAVSSSAMAVVTSDFVVREICASTQQAPAAPGVPQVSGVAQNSQVQTPWPAQLVATVPGPAGGTMQIYRYVPDPAKVWKSLRVLPYTGAHLLLLGLSGIDWVMQDLSNQNEAAKDSIKDNLNQNGNGGGDYGEANPGSPVSDKHQLLEPGVSYEVEVEVEWAGWLKSTDQPNHPTLQDLDSPNAWKTFSSGPVTYRFTVAAQGVPNSGPALLPPPDFQNESLFDPRALQRYLIGFMPDGGLPHFLDDPIVAKFAVEYVDRLLQMYGRKLAFKLRRTDPPAGSLVKAGVPFQTPGDMQLGVEYVNLDISDLPLAEQWLDQAADKAPCVAAKGPKGQQAVINCKDLEPDAEYDLLLVAHPANQPESDEVLIARAHFRTSKYRHVQGLLTALGMKTPANPLRAHDLFVPRAFGPQVVKPEWLQRDFELEEWLRTLDLDPLPLPTRPRVSVVWEPSGQSHLLCAVLVDTDEATYRGDRMSPGALQLLRPNLQTLTLNLLRSNAAGTRLMYWLNTPVAPPQGSRLKLDMNDRKNIVSGSRAAGSTPRAVLEEKQT